MILHNIQHGIYNGKGHDIVNQNMVDKLINNGSIIFKKLVEYVKK